jgi:hypothetical protein
MGTSFEARLVLCKPDSNLNAPNSRNSGKYSLDSGQHAHCASRRKEQLGTVHEGLENSLYKNLRKSSTYIASLKNKS